MIDAVNDGALEKIILEYKQEIRVSNAERFNSYIKYWEPKHKWGYIKSKQPGKDYGFNLSNLSENSDEGLIEIDAHVNFTLKQGSDGVYFADDIKFVQAEASEFIPTIKSWNSVKGSGFINSAAGKDIVFFKDKIISGNLESISPGDKVEYKLKVNHKKVPYAVDVSIDN
ncbi:cold-shock protein [Colwellia sp. MEBiC06753]